MTKLLIIDDSQAKLDDLCAFFATHFPEWMVGIARSFQTGVRQIVEFSPDLILLDMSLPTFDGPLGEGSGRERIFGGRDILEEMEFMDQLSVPVVIISQFDYFGEGAQRIELKPLYEQLKKGFSQTIIGYVYYSNLDTRWGPVLLNIINEWRGVK